MLGEELSRVRELFGLKAQGGNVVNSSTDSKEAQCGRASSEREPGWRGKAKRVGSHVVGGLRPCEFRFYSWVRSQWSFFFYFSKRVWVI